MQVELLRTLRHPADVACVALSPGCLATCSSDKVVRLYSLHDYAELPFSPLLHHKYQAVSCAFSTDGQLLVTCSVDGTAVLVDLWSGSKRAELINPSGKDLRVCRLSPSASVAVTGSIDGTLCVWELASYTLIRSVQAHEESLNACAYSPDGSWLVTGSSSGDVAIWDAQYITGKPSLRLLDCHDLGVSVCQFSSVYHRADAKKGQRGVYLVATAGADDNVKLWELCIQNSTVGEVAMTCKMTLRGHTRPVYSCCFSPDGSLLASGGCDYAIILWDVSTGQKLLALDDGHARFVNGCAFSTDGHLLATASSDKTVKVWKIAKTSSNEDQSAAGIGSGSLLPAVGAEQGTVVAGRTDLKPVPVQYLCPITRELMIDPVVASDGFTYERSAIENWFNVGRRTSPMTNAPLQSVTLRPDNALAQRIQVFRFGAGG